MSLNNLKYCIKGGRLYIFDDKKEKIGFVALVYESGLNIPEHVEELAVSCENYCEVEQLIDAYLLARKYAASFKGHTVPETVAGFAVCRCDGACELILNGHRVGKLLVESGIDSKGDTIYSLVNTFKRDSVSIQEGDWIQSGRDLFKISGLTIYTDSHDKVEMFAALNWAIEEVRDPHVQEERENRGARSK